MFAPITQKLSLRGAGMTAALLAALIMTGCTAPDQPLPAESSAMEVKPMEPDFDSCANLDNVETEQERIDAGLDVVMGPDYVRTCLTPEEALAFSQEEERKHQEKVSQATLLVLGPQPSEGLTSVDKVARAIAYYCNNYGNNDAAEAAKLVYNANFVPNVGGSRAAPGDAQFDNDFHEVSELVCGHLIKEEQVKPVAPMESPSESTIDS